jgi:hypothetical protein
MAGSSGGDQDSIQRNQVLWEAEAATRYDFVTAGWAGQWPSEEIWRARRR